MYFNFHNNLYFNIYSQFVYVFLNMKTQFDWVHTGIVIGVDGDLIHTIEGNTNDEGSREGFEVCLRRRNFKTKTIDIFKVA